MNEETTDLMTPEQPEEPPPRRLLRSRQDRMLAGVAGGLGRYFNVDPVIFRIGFVIAPFVGFGFFWAHGSPWGALWLLVPIGIGAAVYALVRQRGGTVTPLRALAVL